jgi:spore germination protein YaaH
MGIPAFGYDWDLLDHKQSRQVTWNEFEQLSATRQKKLAWDEASSSPHLSFTEQGHPHAIWAENARSLELEMQLVAKYHLAGVSVYALGMEDDAFWKALR